MSKEISCGMCDKKLPDILSDEVFEMDNHLYCRDCGHWLDKRIQQAKQEAYRDVLEIVEEVKLTHRLAKYDPKTGVSSDLRFLRYDDFLERIKSLQDKEEE